MDKDETISDPAHSEPSQARLESRGFEEGGREPDPTDFFIRMMKRAAMIGAARLEAAHERSEAERAARRAAAETVPAGRDDAADPAAPARQAAQDRADQEYQRVTRAMRYCAGLAIRFYNERLDRDLKRAAEAVVEDTQRRSRRKSQLERAVKEAIKHEAHGRDGKDFTRSFDVFDLRKALSERLDDEDIERDLERCSLGELIGRICRDLGLKPDWTIWNDAFWALEEARLKPSGSPYAAPPVAPAPEAPRSQAAEPPEPEPETVKPEDPTPPEPEPVAVEAEDPEPPEAEPPEPEPVVPAAMPRRDKDWYRSPEHQRELEEHKARVIARYSNPFQRSG